MSDKFWEKLNYIFGVFAIGIVFGLTSFMASLEIKDLDLWLHLKMGHLISEQKTIPDHDMFSCSLGGKSWVNHEWLFQVIIYQIWHVWDFNGLIRMQVGVVLLTFVILLLLGYSKERQFLTAATLLLVLFIYQNRFTIRPDIFSLLFFVSFIWILSWFINRSWSLWALVIIQILWTNIHGFFFFGPLLVLIAILSEFLKRQAPLPWEWKNMGRLTDEEYARAKMMFPILLLACCVNPLTIKGALYPLSILFGMGTGGSKVFFQHITELQKPITSTTIWTPQNGYYKIMILISTLSLIFNRRKIDISTVFIWGLFLIFSLTAVRNMVFFAVASYIVFTANASLIDWQKIFCFGFSKIRFKFITALFIKLLFIFWLIDCGTKLATNGYFNFDTLERKSEFWGVAERAYPYHAVNFLVKNDIKGNFFNDFNSGAYLIGRCFPNIKVYIDGRTEEYGGDFFEHYQKIWRDGDSKVFLADVQKYNITGAFLNNNNQLVPEKVLKMFYDLKDWKMVYFDYDAVIFLKNIPTNKTWIDRFAIDLKKWQPVNFDLQRVGSKRLTPYPILNRAYLLKTLGFNDAALKQAQEALKISPDEYDAFKIIAEVYEDKGDYRRSFENFRIAIVLNSTDTVARLNLARAYVKLKDYKNAAYQYGRIIDSDPRNAKAYFGMAKTFALQGLTAKATEFLNMGQRLDPKDKIAVEKIHDIMNQGKKIIVATNSVAVNQKK